MDLTDVTIWEVNMVAFLVFFTRHLPKERIANPADGMGSFYFS